jgi:uncharacterized PurR-regulated membrane protein YhhQ (DUF165 family)
MTRISFVSELVDCFVVMIIRFSDNNWTFEINISVFRLIVWLLLIKFGFYTLLTLFGIVRNILYVCF